MHEVNNPCALVELELEPAPGSAPAGAAAAGGENVSKSSVLR
jgi:hypothetical protein